MEGLEARKVVIANDPVAELEVEAFFIRFGGLARQPVISDADSGQERRAQVGGNPLSVKSRGYSVEKCILRLVGAEHRKTPCVNIIGQIRRDFQRRSPVEARVEGLGDAAPASLNSTAAR